MTRVVVLTENGPEDLPGLEALPDDTDLRWVEGETALRDALGDAQVLVVTDFRTGLLERCWPDKHQLQWVHATSAGIDALNFPALMDSDIAVTNARGFFDRGIAEYVLGAILLFAKDTLGNLYYQRRRQWCHRDTELIEARRVLVVGAGSIGTRVAGLLRAAGMSVSGLARSARPSDDFEVIYAAGDLHRVLPEFDFVVITAPLTDETRGLFDRRAFAAMKKSARLINVGRGPIVNTDDLLTALRSGVIAGAALDVFEQEPLPAEHPLWQQPDVMISAHMAGDFVGWRRKLGEQFVANYKRWRAGEELHNLVQKK